MVMQPRTAAPSLSPSSGLAPLGTVTTSSPSPLGVCGSDHGVARAGQEVEAPAVELEGSGPVVVVVAVGASGGEDRTPDNDLGYPRVDLDGERAGAPSTAAATNRSAAASSSKETSASAAKGISSTLAKMCAKRSGTASSRRAASALATAELRRLSAGPNA